MTTKSYQDFKKDWRERGLYRFQVVVSQELYDDFVQTFGRYKLSDTLAILMRRAVERELSGLEDLPDVFRQEIKHLKGSISHLMDHPVNQFTPHEVDLLRLLIEIAGPLEFIVNQWLDHARPEDILKTSPQALINRPEPSLSSIHPPGTPDPKSASRKLASREAKT